MASRAGTARGRRAYRWPPAGPPEWRRPSRVGLWLTAQMWSDRPQPRSAVCRVYALALRRTESRHTGELAFPPNGQGRRLRKRAEQHPHRISQQRGGRRLPLVHRVHSGGATFPRFPSPAPGPIRGHARTIRFDRRAQTGAPGSRECPRTRHSCLRCILRSSMRRHGGGWNRKGRGRGYAPTCVVCSRWSRRGCGGSEPVRHRLPGPRRRAATYHHDHCRPARFKPGQSATLKFTVKNNNLDTGTTRSHADIKVTSTINEIDLSGQLQLHAGESTTGDDVAGVHGDAEGGEHSARRDAERPGPDRGQNRDKDTGSSRA